MFMRIRPASVFPLSLRVAITLTFASIFFSATAATLDTIGVNLLRAVTTNLNGSGIRVAQVEGIEADGSPPHFEVNPAFPDVNSTALFIFHSDLGIATNYPNSVGVQSYHALSVGQAFYGSTFGVATNLSQVDNFEADHFLNTFIGTSPTNPGALIINQSFTFGEQTVSFQQSIDSAYDDTSAQFGTPLHHRCRQRGRDPDARHLL